MILSFLFWGFVAYLLFKVIADFVLPVYRTTTQVKRKFREMQEQMNNQHQANSPGKAASTPTNSSPQKVWGDYIDFEEVKDK